MPVPRVYVAAPYPERDAARRVAQALEQAGLDVTSTWVRQDDAPSDASARRDLADLARADVLVALNPAAWADRGTGGRHVEFGYALALGKALVVVGVRSHVFHELPAVTVVPDVAALVAQLTPAVEARG
jgi:nucleoside 2-deoxyribosyltransferase